MKKCLFFMLLILTVKAYSQDFPQQKMDAKISKVTVFLSGAQVQRTATASLPEEQIPVSTDKQIDVDFEAKGAIFDKIKGRLTWKLDLKPSEERKQKFSYSVKHPADWNISLE